MRDSKIAATREEDEVESQWRDLALQFDGHRIEALLMLRYVSEATNQHEATGRIGEIRAFLAKPPLSGEAVLAKRIAALASPILDAKVADVDELAEMATWALCNHAGGAGKGKCDPSECVCGTEGRAVAEALVSASALTIPSGGHDGR